MKISVVEARNQRRVVLEGKLLAPWVTELRTVCEKARADLQKRELALGTFWARGLATL